MHGITSLKKSLTLDFMTIRMPSVRLHMLLHSSLKQLLLLTMLKLLLLLLNLSIFRDITPQPILDLLETLNTNNLSITIAQTDLVSFAYLFMAYLLNTTCYTSSYCLFFIIPIKIDLVRINQTSYAPRDY